MTELAAFSDQIADAVARIAPSVVQVQGQRALVSGVVYADDIVVTNARALGGEDGLAVRVGEKTIDAELHGWDPTTGLAVLRVADLGVKPIAIAKDAARVGHFALAVARSWSGAVTASSGIVSIIGGPLRTGRRRSIDEVLRTNAPMHDGFTGGAFCNAEGELTGVITAREIRGLRVVVPARIAWAAAATLLEHGQMRRGYLGVAGQPARAGERHGVLIADVRAESPAAAAGLLVGDVIVAIDGHPVESPEDLLDALAGDRTGKRAKIEVIRGGESRELEATIGERLSKTN